MAHVVMAIVQCRSRYPGAALRRTSLAAPELAGAKDRQGWGAGYVLLSQVLKRVLGHPGSFETDRFTTVYWPLTLSTTRNLALPDIMRA